MKVLYKMKNVNWLLLVIILLEHLIMNKFYRLGVDLRWRIWR